ncbi:hypothetical protein D3C72_2004160 [compost metagenome]
MAGLSASMRSLTAVLEADWNPLERATSPLASKPLTAASLAPSSTAGAPTREASMSCLKRAPSAAAVWVYSATTWRPSFKRR